MKQNVLYRAIAQVNRKKVASLCLASLMFSPTAFSQEKEGVAETESLVITGTRQSRYDFDEAESATGFSADVDDLPRTIQVLPEQLIIDQNANDLTEVLSNAAAVTRSDGFGGTETEVNIRGFNNSRAFVDGSPVSSRYNIEVNDVERAEVILGPTSILHGQVSPGGLVNIVTKKPQKESAHSIQLEYDEHGKEKASIDSTGSLSETVQYRVIITDEDSEGFREVVTPDGTFNNDRESFSISPSISFTPTENDTFTLRLNYTEQELPIDRGTVAIQDANGDFAIADIPRERRLGSEFDLRDSEEKRIRFNWDHNFNDSWINKFAIGFYEKEFNDYQSRIITGFNAQPVAGNVLSILTNANTAGIQANGLAGRNADSNIDVTEEDFSLSNSLVGDYEIGGVENTIYIGANYNRRKVREQDAAALTDVGAAIAGFANIGRFARALDVIDINSSTQASNSLVDQTTLSDSDATFDEYGLSIQNLIKATDRLNLLLGVRYDKFEVDNDVTSFFGSNRLGTFDELATPTEVSINDSNDNISTQAGIIFDITENVSIYSSYSDSFTPNYPSVTAGVISGANGGFAPEEASQIEVGLKTKFLNDKIRFSISAYELTRENVARPDNLEVRLNGEEKTEGVDISSSFQFVPGLNILASYSYLNNEIVDDNDDTLSNEGNSAANIPENKARLWGSYEFQGGSLRGLGFGLGAERVDSRFGDDANTFELPSYTVYDAAVWGYIPAGGGQRLRLQAGIKNLTDETYFTASGGNNFRVNVGDPRTLYATARLEF